ASYPWSYTAPEGRLTTLSLTPGENNLYFEPILAASNGWGPVEIDRSNGEQAAGDGKTLSINGKTYTRGYGVHAGSELRFSLKGTGANCTRFTADVGVDDEVGKKGKVVFQVFLDGVKAYDSGAMKGKDPARQVDLDITGKQELRLVVTDAGNGINFDHADWAQPKIFCVATTPPTTPNVQMSLAPQELLLFHKHSANLKATFSSNVNLGGPLDLRLEKTAPYNVDLQLVTTQVDFSGPGTATRDITIAAPYGLPLRSEDQRGSYRLIASRNGQDVASALVTIDVRRLAITTRFEPASVSGRDGETKRVTVVVTIDPPLEAPVELRVYFSNELSKDSLAEIVNVGPSRGDGGTMMADVDILFNDNPTLPEDLLLRTVSMSVHVVGIREYRTPGYGDRWAPLELRVIR
ncbi:NPCBM/NEW2 domain-containing protein, partial [Deinococcus malanensis]